MKSPKLREKKDVHELNDVQIRLNVAFSILPKDEARKLIDYFNDELKLREQLCQFLEKCNLTLMRPSLAPRLTILLDKESKESTTESMKLNNSNRAPNETPDNLIGRLNTESDLWDAALVDYLMECIFWAGSDWFKELRKSISSNPNSNESTISIFSLATNQSMDSHGSSERTMAISVAMATVYALIRHLQLWQLAKQNCGENSACFLHESMNDSTGIVSEVRFLKLLFQYPPKIMDTSLLAECCPNHKKLGEFQNRFAGFLSVLDETAAQILIQFLNDNFLHMFRLIESVFGPTTAHRQNIIEIPCILGFDTILQTFENQNAQWPAPLAEAMPLKFIDKYRDLFDPKVTRWLDLAKDDTQVESRDNLEDDKSRLEDQVGGKQSEAETRVPTPEPSIDLSEKYLLSLDQMNEEELEALAKLLPNEAEDVVKKLLSQIILTNHQISDQLAVQIRTEQINLAYKLIDKAKLNLAQFSKIDR